MPPCNQLLFVLLSEAPVCAAGRGSKGLKFRRRRLGGLPTASGSPGSELGEATEADCSLAHTPLSLFLVLIAHEEDAQPGRKYLSENVLWLIITDAVCCVKSLPVS